MKTKQESLNQYCFDLAVEIIGSDLDDVNRVSDILYREFEALDKFGMINSKYWKTINSLIGLGKSKTKN